MAHTRSRLRASPASWLALAVATTAVLATVQHLVHPGRPFDAARWQDAAQTEAGIRLRMADRLLSDGTLIGRTRAEVVAMLGEPTPTTYFADWDMVYWLGPERCLIPIDSEWLVLRLGPDGRVVEARNMSD